MSLFPSQNWSKIHGTGLALKGFSYMWVTKRPVRKNVWVSLGVFLYFPAVRTVLDLKNVILRSPQVYPRWHKSCEPGDQCCSVPPAEKTGHRGTEQGHLLPSFLFPHFGSSLAAVFERREITRILVWVLLQKQVSQAERSSQRAEDNCPLYQCRGGSDIWDEELLTSQSQTKSISSWGRGVKHGRS